MNGFRCLEDVRCSDFPVLARFSLFLGLPRLSPLRNSSPDAPQNWSQGGFLTFREEGGPRGSRLSGFPRDAFWQPRPVRGFPGVPESPRTAAGGPSYGPKTIRRRTRNLFASCKRHDRRFRQLSASWGPRSSMLVGLRCFSICGISSTIFRPPRGPVSLSRGGGALKRRTQDEKLPPRKTSFIAPAPASLLPRPSGPLPPAAAIPPRAPSPAAPVGCWPGADSPNGRGPRRGRDVTLLLLLLPLLIIPRAAAVPPNLFWLMCSTSGVVPRPTGWGC